MLLKNLRRNAWVFRFLFGNVKFFAILHNMISRTAACGTVVKINLEIKDILLIFAQETKSEKII